MVPIMREACYIGIDTSNYTTSVAVANERGEIVANLKAPLPVKEGARGLRQSDAVFAHTKNLPLLLDRLRDSIKALRPVAVCYSEKPRNAADSYMPCFLSGAVAAHAIAAALDIPIYTCSHQEGHVMAALYSSGAAKVLLNREFGAFHVSGGTTEVLYVTKCEAALHTRLLGGSADLHAGQAIDRIGVAMGLSFPCGPQLEALAGENTQKVPRPRISVSGATCHLSGLENLALKLYQEQSDKALTAAYVLRFISETLFSMAKHVRGLYPALPLVFSGGVMSNRMIAAELTGKLGQDVYFAAPAFSADNAAGVALLCREKSLQ
ncbi:MAG: peptidase M22 [Clostridia bacterium]|nr:peptidase M22 [Clostridia bacterium]